MIENNSNPASGIDQFLAQQVAVAEPTIEELKSRLQLAEEQVTIARNSRDNYMAMYDKVQTFIQASIDNGDWTDEELDEIFWEELSDILDLEIKREIEITITTYWRATVKMPRGEDISELANYIAVDDPELSHPHAELTDVEVRDTTVDRY